MAADDANALLITVPGVLSNIDEYTRIEGIIGTYYLKYESGLLESLHMPVGRCMEQEN